MPHEKHPQTLRELGGLPTRADGLAGTAVVVIDAQHEYLDGQLPLPAVGPAVEQIRRLLDAARALGAPVIHVAHCGRPGGLFAPGEGGEIIEQVAPISGESVIGKSFPNAFASTELRSAIEQLGDPRLVLCGFMTHMCVSSTARAALDLGLDAMVVSDATATRSLPSIGTGGPIAAQVVHEIALAELADRFSVVTDTEALLNG
ncbi:MAG TPA: cysteine hydrolase family protein [Ilumatobacteraceae bacterium]|nr:cysteine hydrolase family protein [Ilumatobacteraceae bacterium]